jgi:hypothetical protein
VRADVEHRRAGTNDSPERVHDRPFEISVELTERIAPAKGLCVDATFDSANPGDPPKHGAVWHADRSPEPLLFTKKRRVPKAATVIDKRQVSPLA